MKFLINLILFLPCILLAHDATIQRINLDVMQTIENAQEIPGLKSDEFKSLKAGIVERWSELVDKGVIEVTAPDKEVRSSFVALQAIVEHVLSYELNSNLTSLMGVIHTPMPATPLCSEGFISKELVDQAVANDPFRLFTVKARTTIIRDYLQQGGNLYIAYPKDGLYQRTPEQQVVYQNELKKHSAHLFDRPLDCATIDGDFVGAIYLFSNEAGEVYAFAIKMSQANSTQLIGRFGLWFGKIDNPVVASRLTAVQHFLHQNSSKPINWP